MSAAISPLAPKSYRRRCRSIEGVRIATAEAGIKYKNRTDLLVMTFDKGTEVAGVFTRSKCPSAPVDLCRANLAGGKARVLVVNSGNANAFTGKRGRESTRLTAQAAAEGRGCKTERDLPRLDRRHRRAARRRPLRASAGRHGRQGRSRALGGRRQGDHDHRHLSEIRDRDGPARRRRRHHQRHRQGRRHDRARHGDDAVLRGDRRADRGAGAAGAALGGNGKDASTPSPSTATPRPATRCCCLPPVRQPSAAPTRVADIKDAAPRRRSARALDQVLKSLALQVVRDGEGARKQVEVSVTGAKSARSAKRIALSIANSPLVKTAIAGEDANWGRVVMAVGKAGEPADRDLLSIWFGDIRVAHQGERDPAYSEEATSAYMKQRGDRDPRRYRARPRQGHGLDLRPHQGICRDQRRLPELARCRDQQQGTPAAGDRAPLRGGRLPRLAGGLGLL